MHVFIILSIFSSEDSCFSCRTAVLHHWRDFTNLHMASRSLWSDNPLFKTWSASEMWIIYHIWTKIISLNRSEIDSDAFIKNLQHCLNTARSFISEFSLRLQYSPTEIHPCVPHILSRFIFMQKLKLSLSLTWLDLTTR